MVFLPLHSYQGVRNCFKRLTFCIAILFSLPTFSAHVDIDFNLTDLNEYIANCNAVTNTNALQNCPNPHFFRSTIDSTTGDLWKLTYTLDSPVSFCNTIHSNDRCNWSKQNGRWATPVEMFYSIVQLNQITGEQRTTRTRIEGLLYNSGCYVHNSAINCEDICQTEQECYADAEAQCGSGLISDWSYTHNNDYSATCKANPNDPNPNPDIEYVIKDPIKGPRGFDGNDGQDGQDGEDGDDCRVYDSLITDAVTIECGTGIQASRQLLYDGKDGKDGQKGEKGDKGEDGIDGKDGINGTNGTNGQDGKDGEGCRTGTLDNNDIYINCAETSSRIRVSQLGSGGSTSDGTGQYDQQMLQQLEQLNMAAFLNGQATMAMTSSFNQMNSSLDTISSQLEGTNDKLDGLSNSIGGLGEKFSDSLNDFADQQNQEASGIFGSSLDPQTGINNEIGSFGYDPIQTEIDVSGVIGGSKYANGSGVSFGSNYNCPAPNVINVLGNSVQVSYQPFCDLASIIRPALLMGAWIVVIRIFLRSL